MATIRTAIQLQDGMTPVIRSINTVLNTCINSFEAIQTASGDAFNTTRIAAAREELNRTSVTMDSVEQNIREASAAQQQFNNQVHKGKNETEELLGKIKNVVTGIAAAVGINKIMNLSDTVAQTTARLDLMNDKQQTTAELQQMIFQSAQRSRGAYQATADAASKLGMQAKDAFSSTAEIVAFTEQLNKTFVIAGTSTVGVESTMLQLTQAMAAGKLQGEELNAILDNAQPIVANIAKYMDVPVGSIKKMASEGMITADIIKNAMFAAANETNAKFESMPKTIGQVTTSIGNQTLMRFQPLLERINQIVNSSRFDTMVTGTIGGLIVLSTVATGVLDVLTTGSGIVVDNWSMIEPIVLGAAAAYVIYNGAALITNGIKATQTYWNWLLTQSTIAQTSATIAAAYAQGGLNAALYACPISWIIIAIIALISIFYFAVAAVNKLAGTSYSATGIIMGSFYVAGAAIGNIIITLVNLLLDLFGIMWNFIASFAEYFANVFNDPVGSIVRLFANMADTVLGILASIASAIDTLFGSKLRSAVDGWRSGLKGAVEGQFGEAQYKAQRLRVDSRQFHLSRIDYGQAWNSGYNLGNDAANRFDLSNVAGANGLDKNVSSNIAATAANTEKMKDSLDITEEDLKYLRDIAEQEVINRFTTAEIKIDMTNHNSINSNMDLDGITDYLRDTLVEKMQSAAEGVHE